VYEKGECMEENKVPTQKEQLLTYLDQVIQLESSKLVGKLLKRFEIIGDIDILKKEAKELIYESFRDMRDIFEAYGKGLELTTFVFKSKEKKNE
jgi:tRNA G37 N-methylase Trm5